MPNLFAPQPVSSYLLGDTWTPQLTVSVGGVNTDVVSLVVRVERPDGSYYDLTKGATAAIVRVDVGIYVVLIPMTMVSTPPGRAPFTPASDWKIRWTVTVTTTEGVETRVGERWAECKASKLVNP